MASARLRTGLYIFLFVTFYQTLDCKAQQNDSTSKPKTRIIFPNHEEEEDFLTKFQKQRNITNGKNLPFGNLNSEDTSRKYTNLTTTTKFTESSTRKYETTQMSSFPTSVTPQPLLTTEKIVYNPIRKCCKRGQVLDKWHKCKKRKHVNRVFLKEISLISNKSEASKYTRNTFYCPRRLINEYVPTNILTNGSVVIEMDSDIITTQDYHCIELTEIELGAFDGLHVVMCSTEGMRDDVGFISKCCANEMVLNEELDKCVDLPTKVSARNWIPPRTIISSQNWRPTGQYHIKRSLFPNICNGSGFIVVIPEQFTTDGEISVMVDDEFTMTEYACADRVKLNDTEEVSDIAALICMNEDNIEVEKCCDDNQVFSLVKQHCVRAKKNEDIWSPYSQFDVTTDHIFHINTNFLSDYVDDVIQGCSEIYNLNSEESQTFLDTGLHTIATLKGKYCIDNMYIEDGSYETLVVICHEDLPTSREGRTLDGLRSGFEDYLEEELVPEPKSCDWTHLRNFYSFLGVVSTICLLATLFVYCILPEFKSMHGKIVISNVTCTLMVNLFILLVYNNGFPTTSGCVVLGYFGYFSNLAMFSWMTVMCFDLGWTFLKARVPRDSSDSKKFLKYSAFGFGLPFFFSCLTALCQLSASTESDFNPNIGLSACFIHEGGNRQLMFFFLPVFFLMIGNISGFAFTLRLMSKTQASVRKASISRR